MRFSNISEQKHCTAPLIKESIVPTKPPKNSLKNRHFSATVVNFYMSCLVRKPVLYSYTSKGSAEPVYLNSGHYIFSFQVKPLLCTGSIYWPNTFIEETLIASIIKNRCTGWATKSLARETLRQFFFSQHDSYMNYIHVMLLSNSVNWEDSWKTGYLQTLQK